jgi:hypothetical protein
MILNWEVLLRKRSWPDFKVLSWKSPGGTEESHEKPQNTRTSGRDLKPGPSERSRSVRSSTWAVLSIFRDTKWKARDMFMTNRTGKLTANCMITDGHEWHIQYLRTETFRSPYVTFLILRLYVYLFVSMDLLVIVSIQTQSNVRIPMERDLARAVLLILVSARGSTSLWLGFSATRVFFYVVRCKS